MIQRIILSLQRFCRKLRRAERPSPFTSGKNLYDFIDVEQLAEYIALAATQQEVTGIINVCTGHPISLAEKAEQFIKEKNLDIRLEYGAFPDRPYDSPGVWGNPEKMRKILKKQAGRLMP